MSREEFRMRLYKINVSTKEIRSTMKNALRIADSGDFESARSLFLEADHQMDELRKETSSLRSSDTVSQEIEEQEGCLQFTELVRDVLKQAAAYGNSPCSPIRYHVYS